MDDGWTCTRGGHGTESGCILNGCTLIKPELADNEERRLAKACARAWTRIILWCFKILKTCVLIMLLLLLSCSWTEQTTRYWNIQKPQSSHKLREFISVSWGCSPTYGVLPRSGARAEIHNSQVMMMIMMMVFVVMMFVIISNIATILIKTITTIMICMSFWHACESVQAGYPRCRAGIFLLFL